MLKVLPNIHPLIFLLIATTLEVSGDAIVRIGIYGHDGIARAAFMLAGAVLLLGYASFLNLAPLEFGQVAADTGSPARRRYTAAPYSSPARGSEPC